MELFVSKDSEGVAIALVAIYSNLFSSSNFDSHCSNNIHFVSNEAKAFFGIQQKLPVLFTNTTKDLTNALPLQQACTIMRYIGEKSKYLETLFCHLPENKAEVDMWMDLVSEKNFQISDATTLNRIDNHLISKTFFVSQNITVADLIIYASLYKWMENSSYNEQILYSNLTRWFNHIQHLPGVKNALNWIQIIKLPTDIGGEKMSLPPTNMKEKRKKYRLYTTNNKNKVNKQKMVALNEDARSEDDVTRIEIKVGKIIKAWRHPDATKLYCEEIDIGEENPRLIASGLVESIPIDQFLHQNVLVVSNMKPKTFRGFMSHGMVLCASIGDGNDQKIELIKPPPEAKIGERVCWEGLNGEADKIMNSKTGKFPFALAQPFFHTDENCIAHYKQHRFITSKSLLPCKSTSIINGSIS